MLIINQVDPEEMKRIHDGSFPLPNLDNPAYISKRSIIDNGNLVAIGLLKITTESILIVNRSTPNITRAKALRALVGELETELKWRKIPDSHVFVRNHKLKNLLESLKFIKCNSGESMVIQV